MACIASKELINQKNRITVERLAESIRTCIKPCETYKYKLVQSSSDTITVVITFYKKLPNWKKEKNIQIPVRVGSWIVIDRFIKIRNNSASKTYVKVIAELKKRIDKILGFANEAALNLEATTQTANKIANLCGVQKQLDDIDQIYEFGFSFNNDLHIEVRPPLKNSYNFKCSLLLNEKYDIQFNGIICLDSLNDLILFLSNKTIDSFQLTRNGGNFFKFKGRFENTKFSDMQELILLFKKFSEYKTIKNLRRIENGV